MRDPSRYSPRRASGSRGGCCQTVARCFSCFDNSAGRVVRLGKIAVASALCAFLGLAVGYFCQSTYTVPSLRVLDGQTRAFLFDGKRHESLRVGEVDTSALIAHLQQASWTNEYLMRKGAWTLEFPNGIVAFVSVYGDFFWLAGTRGYFLIPTENQTNYRSIVYSRLTEPTLAWRTKSNLMAP